MAKFCVENIVSPRKPLSYFHEWSVAEICIGVVLTNFLPGVTLESFLPIHRGTYLGSSSLQVGTIEWKPLSGHQMIFSLSTS